MKTRAVVTGMGAITLIGNNVESFWWRLKDKTVGVAPIAYFDTTDYRCKLAVEVKGSSAKDYMDAKVTRRMEAFSQFTVAASKEALGHSGIDMKKEDPYRVGVCVGSEIGPLQVMEKDVQKLLEKGPSRVNPLLVPLMISSMATDNVAIQFGLEGKCFNVVTAYATDTHSIGGAFRSIRYGEADVMVAGGAEANTTPAGIAGLTSLTALNTTDNPKCASIPFDGDHNGFVMGEGAGTVVLEPLDHAEARGANILAEVVGYGATYDAYYIISSAEDGSGAARAMENAIEDAGIRPEDINYINAHGTNTRHNDLLETKVIKLVLEDHAGKVKINSTKSIMGHLLGAAGGVEFITCVKSTEDRYVHATVGLERPGEGCDPDHTAGDGAAMDMGVAISNSLSFGEHNASLIIRKFNE